MQLIKFTCLLVIISLSMVSSSRIKESNQRPGFQSMMFNMKQYGGQIAYQTSQNLIKGELSSNYFGDNCGDLPGPESIMGMTKNEYNQKLQGEMTAGFARFKNLFTNPQKKLRTDQEVPSSSLTACDDAFKKSAFYKVKANAENYDKYNKSYSDMMTAYLTYMKSKTPADLTSATAKFEVFHSNKAFFDKLKDNADYKKFETCAKAAIKPKKPATCPV